MSGTFTDIVSDVPLNNAGVIPTCVLHLAQSTTAAQAASSTLPSLHYWVTDRSVVQSAIDYFNKQGYDITHVTPWQVKAAYIEKYGSDYPLQAAPIQRLHNNPVPAGQNTPARIPYTPPRPPIQVEDTLSPLRNRWRPPTNGPISDSDSNDAFRTPRGAVN
jgi:hypothetical protein